MQELRANTQVKVKIGPAVAVGDGFTPVTTLSLSSADEAELFKHDSAAVTDISGATFAAITSADGWYNLTLTTSHTDTEGLLDVVINDDSLILPICKQFMVLSEAAYDSKYVAKDDGFMDVNIKTIGRADTQETEATNLEAACAAYSATRGLSGTALPNAAADAAGGLPISDAGGLDLDAKIGALTFTVAGDVDVNVQTWGGTAIATPPAVNATQFSGSATAADNAEIVFATDFATNYNTTNDGWVVKLGDYAHGGSSASVVLNTFGTSSNFNIGGSLQVTSDLSVGTLIASANAIPWNAAWDTEVQSEVDDALVAQRLDELLNADSDIDGAAPPTVGSVFHELMSKTAGSFTFDQTTDSCEALRDNLATASALTTAQSDLDILTGTDGVTLATSQPNYAPATSAQAIAIQGATFDTATDSLEAIRNRGDAAWVTGSFSTHSAADVWAVVTRVLTAGTNIQLPSNGLANVTAWTVDVTGNITGNLSGSVGSVTGAVGSVTGAVGSVTGNVGGNVTGSVGSVTGAINTAAGVITTLDALDTAQDTQHGTTQTAIGDVPTNAELATAIITGLTTALTEGYRSAGATGSVRDLMYEIIAHMGNCAIVSTTKTLKKLDGSTTAKTYTLNDASTPTSIDEAS